MTDKQAEMWAAFEAYQPQADADGHGESWRVMRRERTRDAALAAYCAAPAGSAAEDAALAALAAAAAAVVWATDYAQNAIDALKKEVQP